ncbi:resistance to inhibitors of cholinesterase protein 3 [Aplysia californica]|uniref:Resistance to inhibitors of cholinesterase protein 3 n=1 Tax=Aplysia californica TaxID=6500 RepID=A0ABM0K8C5_APLCA|nr:resistance to inhibitors of cholinesterase protein 3 [Aplysia californica]
MSTLKTIGTVAIMVACFAVIYPRFMHPLILRAFGLNDPPNKHVEENTMYPPGFNKGHRPPGDKKADSVTEDIKRHMRHGPHPGMRAAAEMQRQQSQQGSGRGMMGVVLPMYAIGIVLYLVYTLFKVFNKSKKTNNNNSSNSTVSPWAAQGPTSYSRRGESSHDRMGFPADFDGSSDVRSFLQDRQQRKDLEDLLTRVDDKNVSVEEMRILQRRLEETEAQMTRILQAMQSVQSNVDHMAGPEMTDGMAAATDDADAAAPNAPQTKSNDSSPDMDSYEVVDKNEDGKKVEGDEEGSMPVTKKKQEARGGEEVKEGGEEKKEGKREVNLDGIDSEEEEEESGEKNDERDADEEEEEEAVVEEESSERKIPEMKEEEEDTSVRQRKMNAED